MRFVQNEIYYTEDIEGNYHHFIVTDTVIIESDSDFNAFDEQWSGNFRFFTPQLVDENNPELFFKRAHPKGYYEEIEKESLVKLNIGTAEAVVNNGEITGFNILGTGSNLPKSDSVFVQGKEILVSSGSIHGYQSAKSNHLNKFREDLNSLVANLVEQINSIYNETDSPGEYLFGFDAVLGRPVTGRNSLMEENFGLFGREGDATLKLYRDEVSMRLPFAESENYNILFQNEIYPDDFLGVFPTARSSDEILLRYSSDLDNPYSDFELSASSARRLGSAGVPVRLENDPTDPGDDKIFGNADDGKTYLKTHETVPFRLEIDGGKLPIVGDNYSFKAFLSNPWNLATSLRVQNGLSVDSIVKNKESNQESNDFL